MNKHVWTLLDFLSPSSNKFRIEEPTIVHVISYIYRKLKERYFDEPVFPPVPDSYCHSSLQSFSFFHFHSYSPFCHLIVDWKFFNIKQKLLEGKEKIKIKRIEKLKKKAKQRSNIHHRSLLDEFYLTGKRKT